MGIDVGIFKEESMGLLNFEIFGASGAVGVTLLHPQVVKQPIAIQATKMGTLPLGQLPMARCAARLCVRMVVIVGHFFIGLMMTTRQGLCSSLQFRKNEIVLIK